MRSAKGASILQNYDFWERYFYILKQKLSEISGKVRPAAGTIFYSEPQNKRIVAHIGVSRKGQWFFGNADKIAHKKLWLHFWVFHTNKLRLSRNNGRQKFKIFTLSFGLAVILCRVAVDYFLGRNQIQIELDWIWNLSKNFWGNAGNSFQSVAAWRYWTSL